MEDGTTGAEYPRKPWLVVRSRWYLLGVSEAWFEVTLGKEGRASEQFDLAKLGLPRGLGVVSCRTLSRAEKIKENL